MYPNRKHSATNFVSDLRTRKNLQIGDNFRVENHIRKLRKERKLSIQKLADKLGVAKGTISKLETGEMALTTDYIERIAKALDCRPAEVIGVDSNNGQDNLSSADLALLFAIKALIRALVAGKGVDKNSMLRADFELALNHYRAANKPDAVSVMDALLLLVDDPQRQEAQSVNRKLLELSPGSRL